MVSNVAWEPWQQSQEAALGITTCPVYVRAGPHRVTCELCAAQQA